MDVDLFNEQVELMEKINTHKKNVMKVIREQMKSNQMEECNAATAEASGGRAETGEGRKCRKIELYIYSQLL